MPNISILIVEDELLIAKDIAIRLELMGYHIAVIIPNADEAIKFIASNSVDICILDIQLEDSDDGITLAHRINDKYEMPIIFLTSYADKETISRAKSARPSAYMLKPFNDHEMQIAIDLAVSNFSSCRMTEGVNEESQVDENDIFSLKDSIFLRRKDCFMRVDFHEILWIEAQSNYTKIKTQDNEFMLTITLQKVADQLKPPYFIRIHRSYLVNLNHVDTIDGNRLQIKGDSFPVSRANREEIFKKFNIL